MTTDIKAQLTFLKELQEIDIKFREIEEELNSIPVQIEEAKAGWLKASSALKTKEEELAEGVKRRKDLENGLEDQTIHLREREARLYAIKTNKEYQAALKEISDGKRANKVREDEVLKLMEKNEALSTEITQLSGQSADKEKEFRVKEVELLERKKELTKEKEVHTLELKKIEPKVDKALYDKYNFIRRRYLDPLAPVVKGICQGCNMNIPPQSYNELLRGEKVHFCSNCHRFIYFEEERAGGEGSQEEGDDEN